MKITGVTCHVLLDPGFDRDATSSNQDDIVVEVHTDEGITGIGETDVNAWVARACIEAPGMHTMDLGLAQTLIGMDPLDPVAVWDRLYVGTAMTGRRGAGVHALGALDMALWDICGKAARKPTWQLLGDAAHASFTPYASLLPNRGSSWDDFAQALVDQAAWAHGLGFKGAKLETLVTGPYAHSGLAESDTRIVEVIAAVRRAVGPDFTIMVDVAYAWSSVAHALGIIESWAEHDVFFVETPLWADDLEGYAELARRSPIKIAAGEWLATRYEFLDLMDRGGVHVAQPDVGRVGGLTEAKRVCDLAAERGRLIVPHGWKTGITIAATAHLAAVTPHMPFFEFVPQEVAESALRRELVQDELTLVDGRLALPSRPGLGIELNRDALERFAAAADLTGRP
ncbi:MAG TPA: mandelate racemase/muconate lactonizing enzyme family protein [Gaiellaceae bacterium]|nr:mandelate racemase/muconate lactonizing enzyme family protein [Gaiellaceae bacterium]